MKRMVALGLLLVVPVLVIGAKKAPPFQITEVSVAVTPTQSKGECPQSFLFAGKITATGKGAITYRWDRSDGTPGEVQKLAFTEAGTEIVTTIWELGKTGALYSNYWQVLHILSPQEMTSNEAVFSLDCRGKVFTVSYKDIDVTDIFLDSNCRLWVKHTNLGSETLKTMVRERVWIEGQLVEDANELIFLEPGSEMQHKIGGEPGYMVFYNALVKVEIDTENRLEELSEKNNMKEVRVFCNREEK